MLTPGGWTYVRTVVEVLRALNRELSAHVDPVQLRAADARAAIAADRSLVEVAASVRPPG